MSDKKIAVLGAGAIGGSLGGYLTMGGHDVTLIDQWVENVEVMKVKGLHLSTREGEVFDIPVKAVHLYELASLRESFDIVFISVKGYDTEWSVKFIEPYLSSDGFVVCTQNGVNDELIGSIIGQEREVPCVVTLTASLDEPGCPNRNNVDTRIAWTVGEIDGTVSPRCEELAEILSCAGKSRTTENVMGERWAKLVLNCMSNGLAGLTSMTTRAITHDPVAIRVLIHIGGETVRVGHALGYEIGEVRGMEAAAFAEASQGRNFERVATAITEHGSKSATETRASLLQDVIKGRRTEIDHLNGYVVRKGLEVGVPTPANETMTALIKKVERGELPSEPANLKVVASALD